MSDDPHKPIVLTTAPTDTQAALIVAALGEHGIAAQTTGELTSGFRAEAPGGVRILVKQSDLQQAEEMLRRIEAQWAGDESQPNEESTAG